MIEADSGHEPAARAPRAAAAASNGKRGGAPAGSNPRHFKGRGLLHCLALAAAILFVLLGGDARSEAAPALVFAPSLEASGAGGHAEALFSGAPQPSVRTHVAPRREVELATVDAEVKVELDDSLALAPPVALAVEACSFDSFDALQGYDELWSIEIQVDPASLWGAVGLPRGPPRASC